MKRILILTSLQLDDMEKTIKELKENIDLETYSLMSPSMFVNRKKGNEALQLFSATQSKTLITEPDKIQIVVGPQRRIEKFDEVLTFEKEVFNAQLVFLETLLPTTLNRDIFYNTKDITNEFDNIQELIQYLKEEHDATIQW